MEFVILSLKWSTGDFAVFWGPNDSGYTTNVDKAGRYSQEQIEDKSNYYNDGKATLAIPVDNVIQLSIPVVVNDYSKLVEASGQPSV
ncbi:MAG: hypothetical protein ACW99J_18350 [Candidatus Thorarchaeota archaeon]|jgi:hypothetical protein